MQLSALDDGVALGYTMRDLNQRTGQVMDEIQKYQRPAYITKHGRFIAKVIPLESAKVEAAVNTAIAQEMGQHDGRASSADDAGALVYTMRELNQQTGQVLEDIRKYRRPAYITKRGRFIAKVVPLEPGEVESAVLAAMAREIGEASQQVAVRPGPQ